MVCSRAGRRLWSGSGGWAAASEGGWASRCPFAKKGRHTSKHGRNLVANSSSAARTTGTKWVGRHNRTGDRGHPEEEREGQTASSVSQSLRLGLLSTMQPAWLVLPMVGLSKQNKIQRVVQRISISVSIGPASASAPASAIASAIAPAEAEARAYCTLKSTPMVLCRWSSNVSSVNRSMMLHTWQRKHVYTEGEERGGGQHQTSVVQLR